MLKIEMKIEISKSQITKAKIIRSIDNNDHGNDDFNLRELNSQFFQKVD